MLTRLVHGAAAFVAAASVGGQDTATIRVPGHGEVLDSTVDHTLLPDAITPIVQWIFQKPPWLMWTGAILAAVLAPGRALVAAGAHQGRGAVPHDPERPGQGSAARRGAAAGGRHGARPA